MRSLAELASMRVANVALLNKTWCLPRKFAFASARGGILRVGTGCGVAEVGRAAHAVSIGLHGVPYEPGQQQLDLSGALRAALASENVPQMVCIKQVAA